MKIIISGEVKKILTKEFEGKTTKKLQFLFEDEKRGFVVQEVKVGDDSKIEHLKEGQIVEFEAKLFSPNNASNIYYSSVGEIKVKK